MNCEKAEVFGNNLGGAMAPQKSRTTALHTMIVIDQYQYIRLIGLIHIIAPEIIVYMINNLFRVD
jgi:hypothetical protein